MQYQFAPSRRQMAAAFVDKDAAKWHNERDAKGGVLPMHILIIDGQSGRMGQLFIERVKAAALPCEITAIGTNAIATSAMLKAGADQGATGENPVLVACRTADIIAGPIGILAADSLMGEITPAMAAAVGQADAVRILLPVNKCDNLIAGISEVSTGAILEDVITKVN